MNSPRNQPHTDAIGSQCDMPFAPQPDRYYLGMWSCLIPEQYSRFGKGGDVTFQCFKLDRAPDRWIVIYRFRHFRGERDRVFDSEDVYRWKSLETPLVDEAAMEALMDAYFRTLFDAATQLVVKPEYFPIKGGVREFLGAIALRKPHWIHVIPVS
jgi:hypothetical protein